MKTRDGADLSAMRAFAAAAIAVIGLAFAFMPIAERLDNALLDVEWNILARIDARAAPDDIVIVGIDEASVRAIPEPPGLWHAPLGLALARLAAAHPRAILLDVPLPERSYDMVKPGSDRALFEGLASAVESVPVVATLSIDARTRAARNIHKPYLALLGESRLGLGLLARDSDGVVRRFSLLIPTEDGGFPTVVGRLCWTLRADCSDGLVHFALGKPFAYVPLKSLLQSSDPALARQLFRDRIVLIGETQPFSGRVEAPVNLAGWEEPAKDTPAIVLQAQALRTALAGAAPREATRPLRVLLVSLAALAVFVRRWTMAAAAATAAAVVAALLGVSSLRAGLHLPLVAFWASLALSVCTVGYLARRPGAGGGAGRLSEIQQRE